MIRRIAIALTAAASTWIATAAHAYIPSERYGAFELKFGPYAPNSDAIPTTDPRLSYDQAFDDEGSVLHTALELDWQFVRIPNVMSFAVGAWWGIMHAEDKALILDASTGELAESSDNQHLWIMPFAALAIVRLDVLADLAHIPLVPFFKIGPAWYLWWTKTGKRKTGSGGTLGWQMNPGLALRLDWLDRKSARTFDNEIGVNHSYLFFEFLIAHIDGFGKSGKLPLSPTNIGANTTWMLGLCLEF